MTSRALRNPVRRTARRTRERHRGTYIASAALCAETQRVGDEDRIRQSAVSIIGADERQAAAKGNPVPPPPPLGLAAKVFLWTVAVFWIVSAVDRFATGSVGQGIGCVVGGAVAVLVRYGVIDGINRRRWENPRYRRRWMTDQADHSER